ncbi:1-(5-phosphoribosyl)-5-((5-phosphoribosylamino)methylideneamino)imidazole-4-carboxamide isomerase [Rosa chinensis]|uniref:1-(5-phosphoribosyl)-5-((5-phosphoribosylamino)methylideneamino)imidazole-4-carboxamide isomerase n=1 Tax=Rosa chinensis TaxID=74649 RepID=A0A2P6QQW6_ROSCH|nr:1-(5-phosphoribosyl)-5-((5-phosphoribosylamino)methylideneamino)imidazole-4-carboxamide isomerase [Rosa chinensis]
MLRLDWYNLGGFQVGGGINSDNSLQYIEEGATHVIVTFYVFNNGQNLERLKDLVRVVGKERLVLDLSYRKREGKYAIVTYRWQKFSDVYLDKEILDFLAKYADEFLVHGVDVEGKKSLSSL